MPRCRLICVLLLAAIWLACGKGEEKAQPASGKTTIVFRTMQLRPTFDDYFLPLFKEYEAAHPGIAIRWEDLPYSNYKTKLTTSFMAGEAPDIINFASEDVRYYADEGRIQALDTLVPKEVFDTFVPSLLQDSSVFGGKTYALPWYAATMVTFANTSILESAGLSTTELPLFNDDIPGIAKTIHDKTGNFATFPIYTEEGSLRMLLEEGGQPLLDEKGCAAFDTERGARLLKFWTDLYRDGLVPSEALTATHRRPVELFKTGKLAILSTGPQFLPQVKADAPEIYANTLVGPQMRWKDARVHFVALHVLTISATSKHPKEAVEFATFITNGANQLAFCKRVTIVPSVVSALDDPYFTQVDDTVEGKARLYSADQVRHGRVFRPPPELNKLNRIFEDTTEKVAQGTAEAGPALKEAQAKWNEILCK